MICLLSDTVNLAAAIYVNAKVIAFGAVRMSWDILLIFPDPF